MSIQVRKLAGALGARVSGVPFRQGLSPADLAAIKDAIHQHLVLAIDAADMDPAQQVQIARLFGEPEHHVFFPNLGKGLEHVSVLDSGAETGGRADRWHVDEIFLQDPPTITTLHAQVLPSYGGDTAFISSAAAYEALSDRMKAYIDGLIAVFDYTKLAELSWVKGTGGAQKMVDLAREMRFSEHPLVRTHPESGRKALCVDTTYLRFIKGLPEREGIALENFLLEHLQRPEFAYRHQWSLGDLLVWDNRCVLHYAVNDYAEWRLMHRVSVMARTEAIEAAA